MMQLSEQARRRWSAAFRTIAGTLGAYGLTSLATVTLSLLLARIGMDRVGAVTAATLASFAIFAIISMACFHARDTVRAWGWLLVASMFLGVVAFLIMPALQA